MWELLSSSSAQSRPSFTQGRNLGPKLNNDLTGEKSPGVGLKAQDEIKGQSQFNHTEHSGSAEGQPPSLSFFLALALDFILGSLKSTAVDFQPLCKIVYTRSQ